MKFLAVCLFGILTGVLSAEFGIYVAEDPVRYLVLNLPAIGCFAAIIHIL